MPFETTGPGTVPTASGLTALKVGDQVDKYEVLDLLATGTLASLFRARDPVLNRLVIVKQVHLTGTNEDDQIRKRVRQAADAQKRIAQGNDEHLVQIYDVIDDQRGLFIISEEVDGPSLDEILSRDGEPLDRKQVLGIMAAVSIALAPLHKGGIVHNDLQPTNILLPRTGGLKVSDVGIAPAIDAQHSLGARTVRYMSPEMLRGETVDGRSDLYSLGMISYEMFAGRKRFAEAFKTVMRDERNQAMRWVKWHTNSRTQAPPLHEIVPDLPEKFDELVNRLLEKVPSARIGSSPELLTVIRRHFIESQEEAAELDKAMGVDSNAALGEDTFAAPGHTTFVPQPSKLPVILAGMLLIWVVIGSVVAGKVLMDQQAEREAAMAAALDTLRDAAAELDGRRWAEARNLYAQVAESVESDSLYAGWAEAGEKFAEAAMLLDAGNYGEARDQLESLYREEITKPTDNRAVKTERLLPLYLKARRLDAFSTGITQIEQLIDDNQYDEARDRLKEWKRYTEMPVLPIEEETGTDQNVAMELTSERQKVDSLMVLVEDRERRQEDMETVRMARELAESNRQSEAILLLQDEIDKGRTSPLITSLHKELVDQRDLDRFLTDAEAARATGNIDVAIESLQNALAIRETEQIKQELSQLIARREVIRAQRALEDGETENAEAFLLVALSHDPNNQQAKDLLGTIESTNRKRALLEAARRAEGEGNWDAAKRSYESALQYGPDEEITAAIRKIDVRRNLEIGQDAIDNGDLAKARKHLMMARDREPGDPRVLAAFEQLTKLEEYHRYRKLGDDARDRSDFGEAKYYYIKARDVFDTQEIRTRLDNAEYDSFIASARAAIAQEDYQSAHASAKLAHKLRPTAETREILEMLSRYVHTPGEGENEETEGDSGDGSGVPAEDADDASLPDDAPPA